MAPLAVTDDIQQNMEINYSEKDSFQALYDELEKGIRSMKNGEIFTIEEAWEEIDKI